MLPAELETSFLLIDTVSSDVRTLEGMKAVVLV